MIVGKKHFFAFFAFASKFDFNTECLRMNSYSPRTSALLAKSVKNREKIAKFKSNKRKFPPVPPLKKITE